MSNAEVVSLTQIPKVTAAYLDVDSEAGRTPMYIARRGRLDGALLRMDVWESLRDEATRSVDLDELDELRDRLLAGTVEESSLGELAEALQPPALLSQLPMRFVSHVRSDILTASRRTPNARNLAGFLAHWTRGYLRGSAVNPDDQPGPAIVREVAPAYHADQLPFRLIWARSGERREIRTLLAVRPLEGVIARAWTFPPPMDATTEGEH
ncbi:MAG: hypothetical protein ACTHYR_04220 [Brachybacterium sp.]